MEVVVVSPDVDVGTLETRDDRANSGLAVLFPTSFLLSGVWGGVISSYTGFATSKLTAAVAVDLILFVPLPTYTFNDLLEGSLFTSDTRGLFDVMFVFVPDINVLDDFVSTADGVPLPCPMMNLLLRLGVENV